MGWRFCYLQVLRDFIVVDVCFFDGVNFFFFYIGEIFIFLSCRDSYWVNVEWMIWKYNCFFKLKDYLVFEWGIVFLDYVIEMDMNIEQNGRIILEKFVDDLVFNVESYDFFKVSLNFLCDMCFDFLFIKIL